MTPSAATDDPRWCPFCNPDPQRVFLRLRHVSALWDGFPVTDGHALIVPYRHVPTWFDASNTERAELFSAIDAVCSIIRERGGIDGFNFGVNVGAAAGQTVPHLHQHVIPRQHAGRRQRGGPTDRNLCACGCENFRPEPTRLKGMRVERPLRHTSVMQCTYSPSKINERKEQADA